ncbi:MAG TPA: DUF4266 domain-containing protein, partial [Steroidobacteraceae bacterium]
HDPHPGEGVTMRCTRYAAVGLLLVTVTGCSNLEPWVKPYERQNFADIIMSNDRNPIESAYMNHVEEAREGARGASGSHGGGCGCN